GKETTHEILKKDQEFSREDAIEMQVPQRRIFSNINLEKHTKIVSEYLTGKSKYILGKIPKDIIKAIDLYIGECVEPKVIHDPSKTLANIIAISVADIIAGEECCNYEDILETFKSLSKSIFKIFYIPPLLSFIHPWLHQQFVTIPLRFGWNPLSTHKKVLISRIKPIIEKRLYDKKRLGDAWVAPVDGLQCFLDAPGINPDLNPNNVNYDFIVDAISCFIFVAMGATVKVVTPVLYDLAKRKQYWHELYQEAQEINKQCNGNELTSDDIAKMVKLDSFVKESLRLSANLTLGFARLCISKSYYTFANGYQIPN
ncbi:16304_t:CDS:2, partial [Dentiscutata heterogama]